MRASITLTGLAVVLAILPACQSVDPLPPRICTPRAQDAGQCYGSFTLQPGLNGI
jgi:hypothetical protein